MGFRLSKEKKILLCGYLSLFCILLINKSFKAGICNSLMNILYIVVRTHPVIIKIHIAPSTAEIMLIILFILEVFSPGGRLVGQVFTLDSKGGNADDLSSALGHSAFVAPP